MAQVKLEDAPQSVRTYYDKGIAAMERDNLDYAMDLFEAALSIEPRLLQLRKLLHVACIKKAQSHPPGKLAGIKGLSGLLKTASLLKKSPFLALELSEKLLRIDPFNSRFIKAHCDAAEAALHPEIAIQTLELIKDHQPADLSILEPLARLYAETEQFDREYECRTAIVNLKPNDSAALKKLKDAAARLTMGKAGWQKAESYRDVMRENSKPEDGFETELDQLQGQVDQHPENVIKRKALAEFQLHNRRYSDAIKNMEACLKRSTMPDPEIERKLALAREHQIGFEIAKAEDANDRKRVSELRKKLEATRISNAARQVDRYPNDLQLKFELGKLLIENGNYTEAIQQFQLALRNPQRRIRSLIYLAQAFQVKGQLGIAREQLEMALTELQVMDESRKEVLYELGVLCDTLGESDQSAAYLKEIYAVDIGYRDVADRIEKTER